MSDNTPRLRLGEMADAQELDAMAINDALIQLDAFTDICLKDLFVVTPPASPSDGDMYLLGAVPTGVWSGYAYKLAYCIDGGWRFYMPFDGLRAFVSGSNRFLVYLGGQWIDSNALINASEVSVASAAICDLGAAGSLFVAITGTTTIVALRAGASLLRFVRFAGALTLTYNATSLILPGAANITTAAGDNAIFASDANGNWRCLAYTRANGLPLNVTAITGAGAMVLNNGPNFIGPLNIGGTGGYEQINLWGPNGVGLQIGNTTTGNFSYITNSGGALNISANAGDVLTFNVNGGEKARFDTSGNLGLGASTPYARVAINMPTGPAFFGCDIVNKNTGVSIVNNGSSVLLRSPGSAVCFLVSGTLGSTTFSDIVMPQAWGGVTVVSSSAYGSPPARSYSMNGYGVYLSLSGGTAGTYSVTSMAVSPG